MKKCFFILLIIPAALFSGCKKPGCVGNGGNMTNATRQLSSFNELELGDNINLVLTQGNEERIEIEAPGNILPNITNSIVGNKLTIHNGTTCRWARDAGEKINVHLFFKNLKAIRYTGSGNITNTDTLKLEALQVESYDGAGNIELAVDNHYTGAYIFQGNASITLHGRSDICYTHTNARGVSDMSDFRVKSMVIEYGGISDTRVHVTDEIDAIIFYKGNINYKGNPVILRSLYWSSGRLVHVP